MRIAEKAYAKVNLHLDVLRKRKDGYHDIGTIFQTIGVYDELIFESREDSEIVILGAEGLTPQLRDNLIFKAAMALRAFANEHHRFVCDGPQNQEQGATITLVKSLPAGAGLGGGSADAAATLRGLKLLWQVDVSVRELEELGASLGADIPFMISGGTQIARGIGDILEKIPPKYFNDVFTPLDDRGTVSTRFTGSTNVSTAFNWLEKSSLLIVTPSDFVSTETAYQQLKVRGEESFELFMTEVKRAQQLKPSNKLFFNHFEETVFPQHPQIKTLRDWMIRTGAQFSIMSGSGSSVMGVYKEKEKAQGALEQVDKVFDGVRFKKVTVFKKIS